MTVFARAVAAVLLLTTTFIPLDGRLHRHRSTLDHQSGHHRLDGPFISMPYGQEGRLSVPRERQNVLDLNTNEEDEAERELYGHIHLSYSADASSANGSTSGPDDAAAMSMRPTSSDAGVDEEVPAEEKKEVYRISYYFRPRDGATEEQVREGVDAIVAWEPGAPNVMRFQYGTNNSPLGLDDGYVYCFLVTFPDGEASTLDPYNSYPDRLQWQNDYFQYFEAFMFIYFGEAPSSTVSPELKNAVYLEFENNATPGDVQQVTNGFEALASTMDEVKGFEWGTVQNDASVLSAAANFTHVYMTTFDSVQDRDAYLSNADFVSLIQSPIIEQVRVLSYRDESTIR